MVPERGHGPMLYPHSPASPQVQHSPVAALFCIFPYRHRPLSSPNLRNQAQGTLPAPVALAQALFILCQCPLWARCSVRAHPIPLAPASYPVGAGAHMPFAS